MGLIKKIYSKCITLFTLSFLYPFIYRIYSKKTVDSKKVLFLVMRKSELTNNFSLLYNTLDKETDFNLKCHYLLSESCSKPEYIKRCINYVKDLSTAKYVFLDEATHITAKIDIRPDTFITQLWHGCGAFKKFGYSTSLSSFGATKKTMDRFPPNKNYSLITVSCEEVIPHFEEAMGYERKGTVKATGISRTDVFFDKGFIEKSYENLYKLFPAAKNKKVILYAPTFRGNVENAFTPDLLDIKMLCEKLSDEYVLVIKHHQIVKKLPPVPDGLSDTFAIDLTDKTDINELLCVSDILISDYSSLIFEYSLFERPMIFFAYDLDEYFDSRGFYYDYNELTPGPVLKTSDEICNYISDIENKFDKNLIEAFRKKFMSSCDGKATQRIINEVFAKHQE